MFRRTVADGIELRQFGWEDAEILFATVDRNREHLRQWLPRVDGTRSADDIHLFVSRVKHSLTMASGPPSAYGWTERSQGSSDAIQLTVRTASAV